MSDHLLILRLAGDFYTKARNTRLRFQRRLAQNIRDALSSHGIPHKLETTWSRYYLETPSTAALEVLPRVFGIQSVSLVERRPWETLEDISRAGVEIFGEGIRGRSFAVRASRRGGRERMPFDSNAVAVALGSELLRHAPDARVNLREPEVTAHVELEPGDPGWAHFFHDKLRGHGGLPVGVEGRALSLVSGGFDSAVASWLMLKRGVQLDYLFCNLGGAAHRLGVLKVMKVVAEHWSYGYRPRLFEVDFQPLIEELQARNHPRNWQIVLKRMMVRAGELAARKTRSLGLITGEAMGQVSSQTLQNLAVINHAVSPAMPVLRPLVGFNKDEILAVARKMGVFDLSAAVGEYCDLVPKKPATRASLAEVLRGEAAMTPGRLEEVVEARTVFELRSLDDSVLSPSGLETDRVPEGAAVLDLRSKPAYQAWHYPGAIHLDFHHALGAWPSFGRDRDYVLVCEVGLKSAHLAEKMQQAGFRAWNFRGGLKELMALAERERGSDPALEALLAPALRD
ncbi:MAG TPA: THUMP domain-containing protein [Thermoanaerobaculia bacterium]|nr:THUMP domain-containing protein [Thermoanaerobaculia bacterium]